MSAMQANQPDTVPFVPPCKCLQPTRLKAVLDGLGSPYPPSSRGQAIRHILRELQPWDSDTLFDLRWSLSAQAVIRHNARVENFSYKNHRAPLDKIICNHVWDKYRTLNSLPIHLFASSRLSALVLVVY